MKKYKLSTTFTYNEKKYWIRADTVEELYMKKANKLRDLKENVIIYDSSVSVDAWAEISFDTYKSDVKGLEDIKKRYKKYVSPRIGTHPIGTVKAVECQAVLNDCSGMSFSHCEKLRQEMKFLFETAVDNQLIPHNPAKKLKLPDYTKGSRRSITENERKHLLAVYENDSTYLLFIIMLYCGCRPEEAVNLIGRDIDHENRRLHIRGTKTKNSDRYVSIPAELYETIKKTKPFEPIAKNRAGSKHSEGSYNRLVSHLKRDMNLSMGCKTYRNALIPPFPLADDFVPYCLRHTYCTDLCRAGVDVRTAQKLMGHADISITANIYTHVDLNDIDKAGDLFEAYLATKKG